MMPKSFVCMHSHIIFSTKKRDPLLMPDFTPRLFKYSGGTLRNQKCLLLTGGRDGKVQIPFLVGLHQQKAVCDVVRDIKSNWSG